MKKIIVVSFMAILLFLPFGSVFAYSGGLLDGKSVNLGSKLDNVLITSPNVTDNNINTYVTVNEAYSSDSYLWFKFDKPYVIEAYQLSANQYNIPISFYDQNKKSIGGAITAAVKDGTKTAVDYKNVMYVAIENPYSGVSLKIYEFNVFGKEYVVNHDELSNLLTVATDEDVSLTWSIPSGNADFTGTKIYRNNTFLTSVDKITDVYVDKNSIQPNTQYTYKITGVYSDGYETTGISSTVTTKIPVDTIAPSKPTGLSVTFDGTNMKITFNENTESDLSYYNIYRNGVKLDKTYTNSFTDSSVSASGTYTYQVTAVDNVGNESVKSDSVSAVKKSEFEVNFIPNADSIVAQVTGGIAPYTIDWVEKSDTFSGTSYTIGGLSKDTDYVVSVRDSDGKIVSEVINTGSTKKYIPPKMPSIVEFFQKMLNQFGNAGSIAVAIIGGAVALGIITVLGIFGWRLFKRWLATAK